MAKKFDISNNKIKGFQKLILKWYSVNGREFPWRKLDFPLYNVFIAEILLQRTTAAAVNNNINNFLERFPSWKSIATTNILEIENALKPLGLWQQKSKLMHELAKEMVKRNGRIPLNREELENLPGIGQYIASAILLMGFGHPEPLLDTNMARVLERFFGPRKMADLRYDAYLQELAREVVKSKYTREMNFSILDFAAKVCKPINPDCTHCPLVDNCLYYTEEHKFYVMPI